MLLIDDYIRMIVVFFLRKKLEAFEHFKIYKEMVETEMELKIKYLRSDSGGEFRSKESMNFYGEHGIKRQFSTTKTPHQNGVVESKNKRVQEMVRTMLKDSKLSHIFWAKVVHTSVHILNRGILKSNDDNTTYKLWKGRPTNVKHFRVFGSKFYIKREDGRLGKIDSRANKGILVGYSRKIKEYKCFSTRLNRIVESINVMINERDIRKGKEGSKYLEEQDNEEDLKEEEVEEEAEVEEEEEEEEEPKIEKEEDKKKIPPKTPSR
jgi:hypothetical protein